MGNVRFGIPGDLIKAIRRASCLEVAVETGTYLGHSAAILASVFDRVCTIEAVPDQLEEARAVLEAAGVLSQVNLVLGDSEVVLPHVIGGIHEPALFWLDSHWFERIESSTRPQCPLLAELSIIASWPYAAPSWILIDDVALFRLVPRLAGYRPEEWPTLKQITDLIATTFPTHSAVETEDVLVVAPTNQLAEVASLVAT